MALPTNSTLQGLNRRQVKFCIEWSATKANDKEEQALRNLGRSFVGGLLGKHDVALTGDIQSVEIYRQDNGIDVLARIRDERLEHVILIEDKTDSQAHGDQSHNAGLIRSLDKPLDAEGGLAVLNGSLAPDGAIIKPKAPSPPRPRRRGPAAGVRRSRIPKVLTLVIRQTAFSEVSFVVERRAENIRRTSVRSHLAPTGAAGVGRRVVSIQRAGRIES